MRTRLFLPWVGLACLVLLLSCGTRSIIVQVQVDNPDLADDSIIAWSVQPVPEAQPARWPAKPISGRPAAFEVELPWQDTGQLTLQLHGIDQTGCGVAVGEQSLSLTGADRYVVHMMLVLEQGCRIAADVVPGTKRGAGTVQSIDGRINAYLAKTGPEGCPCDATYPKGASVTLTATPDPDSYFAGWIGNDACPGTGACTTAVTEGLSVVRAVFLPRKPCQSDGWCWEQPLPQGNNILSIHGLNSQDVWTVGYQGTIEHWNGSFWTPFESGTIKSLYGVFAVGPKDVWAVGRNQTVLHYDGSAWTKVPVDPLVENCPFDNCDFVAVWASGPSDVWVVGQLPKCYHWRGTLPRLMVAEDCKDWGNPSQGEGIYSIWGSGPDDVWLVGAKYAVGVIPGRLDGMVRHWDGKGWAESALALDGNQAPSAFPTIWSLWAGAPNDVWATALEATSEMVGRGGMLLHGSVKDRRIELSIADQDKLFGTIFGTSANPVSLWVGGSAGAVNHRTPAGITSIETGERGVLGEIWGSSDRDIWVTRDSARLHYDGIVWSRAQSTSSTSLRSIWGFDSANGAAPEIWAVGDPPMWHYLNNNWVSVPSSDFYCAVWGANTDDIWLGGFNRITHLTKQVNFESRIPDPQHPHSYCGIWGRSGNDVWFVSENSVFHTSNGINQINEVQVKKNDDTFHFTSIIGTANEIWITTDQDLVLRSNDPQGLLWQRFPIQDEGIKGRITLTSIWVSDTGDVWVAGTTPTAGTPTSKLRITAKLAKGTQKFQVFNDKYGGTYKTLLGVSTASGYKVFLGGYGVDTLTNLDQGFVHCPGLGNYSGNLIEGLWYSKARDTLYAVGGAGVIMTRDHAKEDAPCVR